MLTLWIFIDRIEKKNPWNEIQFIGLVRVRKWSVFLRSIPIQILENELFWNYLQWWIEYMFSHLGQSCLVTSDNKQPFHLIEFFFKSFIRILSISDWNGTCEFLSMDYCFDLEKRLSWNIFKVQKFLCPK